MRTVQPVNVSQAVSEARQMDRAVASAQALQTRPGAVASAKPGLPSTGSNTLPATSPAEPAPVPGGQTTVGAVDLVPFSAGSNLRAGPTATPPGAISAAGGRLSNLASNGGNAGSPTNGNGSFLASIGPPPPPPIDPNLPGGAQQNPRIPNLPLGKGPKSLVGAGP